MTDDARFGRKPMARASMREVADRAGVAMSSVSRVLNNHPDVSAPMREKVMAVVAELGYQPDLLAQSLRRRQTRSVGFVVGDIANPLLAEIVKGAEGTLRDSGLSMLLTNSENDPERDAAHIRLLEQRRVDGLMLSLASEDRPETIELLRQFGTPAVLVDRELAADAGASSVLSDHRTGMRAAVEHLLDLGHRRIGLILGQPMRPSRERRAGLEEAFAERDLPATYTVVDGQLSADHGRDATRQLLDQDDPPTAIIAGGNQLLVGTLAVLLERQVRVGRDVSLISCDAIDVTELFDPPIAVVLRDNRQIGVEAARLLIERLDEDDDPGPRTVVLPTVFHPRASCGPPPDPS